MGIPRGLKTMAWLAVPWLLLQGCLFVLLHFLLHPISTLSNPDAPAPPVVRVTEWLMELDAFVLVVPSLPVALLLLILVAVRRGMGPAAGQMIVGVPFVAALLTQHWLVSDSHTVPDGEWVGYLLHRTLLLLAWLVLAYAIHGTAHASRLRAEARELRGREIRQREAELLA